MSEHSFFRSVPIKTGAKIAILLPDLRVGGAERVCVNLANDLSRRGHRVEVVLLQAIGPLIDDLDPSIRVIDLRVARLRWSVGPIARYLRQSRPEAMLACMWPLTSIAVLARRMAFSECRLVVAEHTTWSLSDLAQSPFTRHLVRYSMRLTLPRADAIVCVSNGAADDLSTFAGIDGGLVQVIYNPVVGEPRTSRPEAKDPLKWWNGEHFRILAVGALKEVKDFPTLLRAFAILRKRHPARLLILGEGACRSSLEHQVRVLDVVDDVFLPGFVQDTHPYFQHADLHVLSSQVEGLPTVIIEALAAGTPVVSTDCRSGPREILLDGRLGSLVPVGDADALATAMETSLLDDHDSSELRRRAMDFSIHSAATHYETVLLPNKSKRGESTREVKLGANLIPRKE